LEDGNHYLDIHAEAAGGPVVSCADVPGGISAGETAVVQRTDSVRLQMHEQGGSGVTGDLLLWESRCCAMNAGGVSVAADVDAGSSPGSLAIDLHTGSCAVPSPFEIGIGGYWEPMTDWFGIANPGKLSYQGSVPIELSALRDGDHYIQIRAGLTYVPDPGGNLQPQGGVVVACADIPDA
jgi:hypothetical protein